MTTKKAKKEKCKEILNRIKSGKKLVSGNEDFNYLMDIFSNHPSWARKQGVGVEYITKGKAGRWNTDCFYIFRKDASHTDISYIQCIDKPMTARAKISRACRTAVWPTIQKFRSENVVYGVTKCPVNDEILTRDNTHIDHYDLRFSEVFDLWMKDKPEDKLMEYLNKCSVDGCVDIYFTHQGIINNFVNFHNENTHLRAMSKKANLERG